MSLCPLYIRRRSPTLIMYRSHHREVNPTSPHVCGIALGPPPQSRLPEQGPPQRDKNPGLQGRRHPNLLYGSENCPRDRRQVKVIPPTLLRSIPHIIGCGDCYTDIGVWAEMASIESASIRDRLRRFLIPDGVHPRQDGRQQAPEKDVTENGPEEDKKGRTSSSAI